MTPGAPVWPKRNAHWPTLGKLPRLFRSAALQVLVLRRAAPSRDDRSRPLCGSATRPRRPSDCSSLWKRSPMTHRQSERRPARSHPRCATVFRPRAVRPLLLILVCSSPCVGMVGFARDDRLYQRLSSSLRPSANAIGGTGLFVEHMLAVPSIVVRGIRPKARPASMDQELDSGADLPWSEWTVSV